MVPAVRSLAGDIRAARARPLLFLTWGRENGLEDDPSSTFSSHQEALQEGYLEIALELDLAVAPVGPAWRTALRLNPELSLWQQDGSHPSLQGSYLAACVFYAVIFDESPLGLEYTAGLAPETAAVLHSAAAQSVLENPSRWNLP